MRKLRQLLVHIFVRRNPKFRPKTKEPKMPVWNNNIPELTSALLMLSYQEFLKN